MASFEEDQIKIAEIRAKMLKGSTKAELDQEINDYFDTKVSQIRKKLNGTDKANKASEEEQVANYYNVEVANVRKKEVGNQ